jgi:hypothetical protein
MKGRAMNAAWISILVGVTAGYCIGLGKFTGQPPPCTRNKKIVLTPDGSTGRCTAKTTPPRRTLSLGEQDTIRWKVQGLACLQDHPEATVQIRFADGTSPLEPAEPFGRREVVARLNRNASPGTYKYDVWLTMPDESESYRMEDPELLIEI